MDTMQIQYFLAVDKYRGFTRAAQVLHLNQSTLSRQIAALEDELGAVLFVRTSGGVQLTEAGEFFLEEGKVFLRRFENMRRRIGRLGIGDSGTLVVGMPMNLFGSGGILGDYDRSLQGNDVAFRYCLMDFDSLNAGLINGDIDIAITYDFAIQEIRDEVKSQFIFKEPFVFLLKREHTLDGKKDLTVTDLIRGGSCAVGDQYCTKIFESCTQSGKAEREPGDCLYEKSRQPFDGGVCWKRSGCNPQNYV